MKGTTCPPPGRACCSPPRDRPPQLPAQPPTTARVDGPERSIHPSLQPASANLTTGWLPPARPSPVGRAFFPPPGLVGHERKKKRATTQRPGTRDPARHRQISVAAAAALLHATPALRDAGPDRGPGEGRLPHRARPRGSPRAVPPHAAGATRRGDTPPGVT